VLAGLVPAPLALPVLGVPGCTVRPDGSSIYGQLFV
jgi:hypothetical protein